MLRRAKNYTKRKKIFLTQKTDRTVEQIVKAKLYTQNNTKKHTHSEKEKKEKIYIYIYIYKKRQRATQSINKCTNDNKL